ncbi:hypothetical protein M1O54_03420 [Dehalococcoidia bacterium]|nr:hypothetical protein [Dehalococcoidia bacterium]MCL0089389.1 hypothetical protein [Dehalococcoidia bacterium]
MSGINFQTSYHLGQEYENIKNRATKILGKYLEDSNLISFDDVEKRVTFTSERLAPVNRSKRPPVMLLFSNPHPHSIKQGMFLSANIKNRENLFWPTMRNAGWFSIPEAKRNPEDLRDMFLQVKYPGPFELYFYCYYVFPTRLPDDIRRIFGKGVFDQIIKPNARDEFTSELNKTDAKAVVTFNKGIFNLVSDEKIKRYIAQLNKGEMVQGRIIVFDKGIPIFLTHPTGWRYDKEFKTLRETSLKKIKAAILKGA